jgi:hypothetical protein
VPKGGYVPEFTDLQRVESNHKADALRLSILPPENTVFDSFAISPDGRKLAFTAALGARTVLWIRESQTL